jgi:hypothetical protein
MEKPTNSKFINLVLVGMMTPFLILAMIFMLPFYFLGLFFNWAFKLELL